MSSLHRGLAARVQSLSLGILGLASCSDSQSAVDAGVCGDRIARPTWWRQASHCPQAKPDYAELFEATRVRRLDFTIDRATFAAAQTDLDNLVANAGTDDLDAMANPMWMEATLSYGDQQWTGVAVRWKGHASLAGAWSNHIGKLSMAVKFDRYNNHELTDQRFFGFSEFTLSAGYKDDSLIRDKVAADVLRAAGVPAPQGSFTQVFINIGNGPFYMGMYTMIEKVEDQMLATQLGSSSGNLYKPWGDAARWPPLAETAVPLVSTSQADIETHFEKANNKSSDWTDIVAAINVLHSGRSDAAAWRAKLESVLDVQAFLKWLAVNQTMVNWDAYGCMPHNYYVYADPAHGGRFLWLPWDLNEALAARKHDGCVPGSVMLDETVSGSSSVAKQWPLIAFILADPTYRESYKAALRTVLAGPFDTDALKAKMRTYHALIAPYIDGTLANESGAVKDALFTGWYSYQNTTAASFATSLTRVGDGLSISDGLETHVDNRRAAVQAALASSP
jgi:spore coat protein CotH